MNKSAQRLFEYFLIGVLGLLPIVIIIQNQIIRGFDNKNPDVREGPFGTYLQKDETYEERYWKEVGIKP